MNVISAQSSADVQNVKVELYVPPIYEPLPKNPARNWQEETQNSKRDVLIKNIAYAGLISLGIFIAFGGFVAGLLLIAIKASITLGVGLYFGGPLGGIGLIALGSRSLSNIS